MNTIKVGTSAPRHNMFVMALKYPPIGVKYKILEMDHVLPNPKRSKFIDWQYLETEDLSNFFIMRLIKFRDIDSVDLLHTIYSVSVNDKPWVSSFGYFPNLVRGDLGPLNFIKKTMIGKYLGSEHCKFLLPWSEWAKKSAEKCITNPQIIKKLKVVSPLIKIKEGAILDKDLSKIKFLFVSNQYKKAFKRKGGPEVLNAFNSINEEYPNITLTIVGNVEDKFIKKNESNRNIKFTGALTHQETLNEFQKHQVFIFPTKIEAFGYSVLEAMSYGLPVITCNHSALPELVTHGKNGFLLNAEFKSRLVSSLEAEQKICQYNLNSRTISNTIEIGLKQKMELFIEDPNLINKMGKQSKKIVKSKFSIKKRNKLMKEICEEAMVI